MSILVTGGAGYIGSHTCVELLNAGYDPIILDNFCNSKSECVKRVKEITGKDVKVYNCDIRDRAGLDKVLRRTKSRRSSILRVSRACPRASQSP